MDAYEAVTMMEANLLGHAVHHGDSSSPVVTAALVTYEANRVRSCLRAADEAEARSQEARDRLSAVPNVHHPWDNHPERLGSCHSCGGPILPVFGWTRGDRPGERDYRCPACGKPTRFYSAAWIDPA